MSDAETIAKLKREITIMQEQARLRNVQLDAMCWTWCTGGCKGGVFRYSENSGKVLTEEMVEEAERNVKRLRTWLNNVNYRNKRAAGLIDAPMPCKLGTWERLKRWLV